MYNERVQGKRRVQGTGSKKQGSGFREKGEAVYRGGSKRNSFMGC